MAMNLQPNPSPDENKNTFPTGSVFFHVPDGKTPRTLSPTPSSISHSTTKKSPPSPKIYHHQCHQKTSPVSKKSTTTKKSPPSPKNLPPSKNLPVTKNLPTLQIFSLSTASLVANKTTSYVVVIASYMVIGSIGFHGV